jgi:HK97 family phage major capsid protein
MGIEYVLELRRKRAAIVDEIKDLLDAAKRSGRDLNTSERSKYDQLMAEARSLKEQEDREIQLQGLEAEVRSLGQGPLAGRPEATTGPAGEWRSFGDFLQAVVRAGTPGGQVDPRLETRAASGLNESVPSEGGFLVSEDYARELLRRTYATGQIASRCRRIPISANANSLKINAIDETSRADGSRFGGVQSFWTAEADAKTATKPKFREMTLELKKLTGLCYLTDELLQDAAALESVVMQSFADEISFKLEDAIIRGDGAGKPLGILNSPALVTVAKETGQAANTVIAENIFAMWSRCWGRSRQNAVWLINQDVEPQLFSMSMAVGTGGVPVYMPAGGISGQPYSTLFGRPVIPVEYCPTLGTVGDIILVDLSQYLLIDKGGIQTAASIHVRFVFDESCLRVILRVDGQPIRNSALTPYKGSNTLSPYVALATRG